MGPFFFLLLLLRRIFGPRRVDDGAMLLRNHFVVYGALVFLFFLPFFPSKIILVHVSRPPGQLDTEVQRNERCLAVCVPSFLPTDLSLFPLICARAPRRGSTFVMNWFLVCTWVLWNTKLISTLSRCRAPMMHAALDDCNTTQTFHRFHSRNPYIQASICIKSSPR